MKETFHIQHVGSGGGASVGGPKRLHVQSGPKLGPQQIAEPVGSMAPGAVGAMKFVAITLDTNIFDENGLRLDEGLLSQLNQFKDSLTEFVLSDIVSGELKRHLTKSAQQAKDSLMTALPEPHSRASMSASRTGLKGGRRPSYGLAHFRAVVYYILKRETETNSHA